MALSPTVNWPEFLAQHDMQFDTMPKSWEEAPYFGNGNIASMIYQTGPRELRLQLFRSDVHDHRDNTHGWTAYSRPRFMLGWFELKTCGEITSCSLRMDLWNAELNGTVITTAGSIELQHIVHSLDMALMCRITPTEGEIDCQWHLVPGKAETTRPGYPADEDTLKAFAERYGEHYQESLKPFEPNPPVREEQQDDITAYVQDLKYGGQYCIVWKDASTIPTERLYICSIMNSYPESTAYADAVSLVKRITDNSIEDWLAAHRNWWHDYFPISFVELPDKKLENIYWHQIYKLACATRADQPMMDTSGPWIQPTPWPYITWDLNVQLCYWPVCGSGRLALGESLINTLHKNRENLIKNVQPEAWQKDSALIPISTAQDCIEPRNGDKRYYDAIGNLPWALHNCWQMYRHTMDDDLLREKIFPLLRRSVNLYFHMSEEGDDGKIHLKSMYSPEYNQGPAPANPDCNYDLALFRWGCQTLLDSCERLGIEDDLKAKWQDVVDRLVDYSQDATGLSIARGVPLAHSHRHYSHLLMIYPLYLMNREQEGTRELMQKSLDHWISFEGALMGYSFTGASSISAALGDGDKALEYLEGLYPFLLPNGMYKEAGPVMETPLSAAQCIHDMLIQSWGGVVRVMPALPSTWQDLRFDRLRTEGAFEVSAIREGGKIKKVTITSLAGEPLRVEPGLGSDIIAERESSTEMLHSDDGRFSLELNKGESVTLSTAT